MGSMLMLMSYKFSVPLLAIFMFGRRGVEGWTYLSSRKVVWQHVTCTHGQYCRWIMLYKFSMPQLANITFWEGTGEGA